VKGRPSSAAGLPTPSEVTQEAEMTGVGRAAITAILAACLLVAGGIGLLRGGRDDPTARSAGTPSTAGLLGPALGSGSLESSIAALQDRLGQLPEDWRGYASLGLAYVAQARVTADPSYYPKAEDVLRRSLRLNGGDNVDAVLGMGALALARHDFEAALALGLRAEALGRSADAHGVIGDALLELGRYDEAFDAFQAMVDARPNLASYARASYARELLGDVTGAIEAMRLAFDAAGSPADAAWAAQQLGELSWGIGDVREAAAWYERGIDLDPTFVSNLAGLAKVAWARGNPDLAIERYTEVVERYPAAEHLIALGDLYATTGRPELAEQQYAVVRATAELANANGVNVDLELALFDADHGDPRAALAAAEGEWERRTSVHVADAYAWVLYGNGRFAEAAELSERALEVGTRNATFLFHAGMIHAELGDLAAARALLAEALDRNPNFSILHVGTAERTLAELGWRP
jgi:tetratricopeptide (TPR) repeat protein